MQRLLEGDFFSLPSSDSAVRMRKGSTDAPFSKVSTVVSVIIILCSFCSIQQVVTKSPTFSCVVAFAFLSQQDSLPC
jgi:hypothetical protein